MVSGIGVAIWVYVETGSAIWLGALTALAGIPVVLASPLLDLASAGCADLTRLQVEALAS